jgi:hypothetical protein
MIDDFDDILIIVLASPLNEIAPLPNAGKKIKESSSVMIYYLVLREPNRIRAWTISSITTRKTAEMKDKMIQTARLDQRYWKQD